MSGRGEGWTAGAGGAAYRPVCLPGHDAAAAWPRLAQPWLYILQVCAQTLMFCSLACPLLQVLKQHNAIPDGAVVREKSS